MRHTYLLFSLLSASLYSAQETPPTFDGVVTPEEWQDAEEFLVQYEITPGNNVPSPYETKAFVSYSKTHLYVGFIAYADMANLRSSIRNRDEGYQDDNVLFGIDTYGDGRYMVTMGSNPEGNQLDLKFLSTGQDDTSYDITFESKASKHEDSYHVELKIPFSVLQFKNEPEMTWNVLFYRSTYTSSNRSQNMNFPIDLNNPCLPCQTPASITLKNIEPKNRVSLIPYVYGGLSGEGGGDTFAYGKPQGTVGLSGLFDINNTTSLEYAVNPDFSQVEADVSQITANNTFAIFFQERRPYFNEGNDIINTNLNTVYTRAINKPLLSTKVISQGENQRIYWLTAYDEESPYLIAGENRSYFGAGTSSYSNILRYQRNYNQGSNFGFLSTNRFFKDGGYGHTFGVDGLLRFKKSYTMSLEYNRSIVSEPQADWIEDQDQIGDVTTNLDGEKLNGSALHLSLRRNTKNWNSRIGYQQYSPHYQTPLGFVTRNSVKTLGAFQGYQQFFDEDYFLKQLNIDIGSEITFNYNNFRKYLDFGLNVNYQLAINVEGQVSHNHIFNEEFEGFNAKSMDVFNAYLGYNPSELIRLNIFTNFGESLYYDADNPEVGNKFFIGSSNTIQMSPQLTFSSSIRYSQLKNKTDQSLYFSGYIARSVINYQFNKALSFRIVGEFNDFNKSFFYQPLLKWNPNPFTIFYIGGTNGYSDFENNRYSIENSQFYFKFQYQFDL